MESLSLGYGQLRSSRWLDQRATMNEEWIENDMLWLPSCWAESL